MGWNLLNFIPETHVILHTGGMAIASSLLANLHSAVHKTELLGLCLNGSTQALRRIEKSVNCRYCGKSISLLGRLAGQDFCSVEHRDKSLASEQAALARLREASRKLTVAAEPEPMRCGLLAIDVPLFSEPAAVRDFAPGFQPYHASPALPKASGLALNCTPPSADLLPLPDSAPISGLMGVTAEEPRTPSEQFLTATGFPSLPCHAAPARLAAMPDAGLVEMTLPASVATRDPRAATPEFASLPAHLPVFQVARRPAPVLAGMLTALQRPGLRAFSPQLQPALIAAEPRILKVSEMPFRKETIREEGPPAPPLRTSNVIIMRPGHSGRATHRAHRAAAAGAGPADWPPRLEPLDFPAAPWLAPRIMQFAIQRASMPKPRRMRGSHADRGY